MTLNLDVRKRNADMLAAEQSADSEPDNAPPPAKRRQVAKSNVILDDDEEELELELGGVGAHGDDEEHEGELYHSASHYNLDFYMVSQMLATMVVTVVSTMIFLWMRMIQAMEYVLFFTVSTIQCWY
jgi:hypothetical protein